MYEFTISEVLEQAWALTKKHGLLLALILLVIALLEGALGPSVNPVEMQNLVTKYQGQMSNGDMNAFITDYTNMMTSTAFSGSTALRSLVSSILTCALLAIMLSLAKGQTTEITFEPCKMPVMAYVKFIGWNILSGIIVGVGICLCIIPGIWLAARLFTVQFYFIDRPDIDFGEAIKLGWHSTENHALNLIGLGIVCFFIALAGLLCCCVGLFFAEVIIKFAAIIVFLILSGFYNRPSEISNQTVVETVEAEEL